MALPTITTAATILSFFIILSLKNFVFSRGLSVGGGGEDGDPSDSELYEGTNPSDAEKYCEDSDPSDADKYGVGSNIKFSTCHGRESVDDIDDG